MVIAYHTQIDDGDAPLIHRFEDLHNDMKFWYTTVRDYPAGWYDQWPEDARDAGHAFVRYSFKLPAAAFVRKIETPCPDKILLLTRENAPIFLRRYTELRKGQGRWARWDLLQQDFAGVDANDNELWRFGAYQAVNRGPPSGVIWRFGGPVTFQLREERGGVTIG